MKKILILLIIFSFSSCEKDDICDETSVTTPQLVIAFYDKANPTTLKNVENLGVIDPNLSTGLGYNQVSTIKIPLKITADATTFNFIKNGSDSDVTNDITDAFNFTYARENLYVSRACGFKTVFNLSNTNTNLVLTNNWIDHIEIVNSKIDNQKETHVKVYF